MDRKARLPRVVSKYDLTQYFGCSFEYLWKEIITDELLESWGYDYDKVKPRKLLGPDLTFKIYLHFRITDLDRSMSEEVIEALVASGQLAGTQEVYELYPRQSSHKAASPCRCTANG